MTILSRQNTRLDQADTKRREREREKEEEKRIECSAGCCYENSRLLGRRLTEAKRRVEEKREREKKREPRRALFLMSCHSPVYSPTGRRLVAEHPCARLVR